MYSKVDADYGANKEMELLGLIQDTFDKNIQHTTTKYSVVDYTSDNVNVELKTRRCNFDTYEDTMIGFNKIQKLLTDKKDGYAVFNFLDGTYYIEIVEDNVKQFRIGKGGRKDRGRYEYNKY